MKLNVDFSGIDNARKSIGAEKAHIENISSTATTINPIEIRLIKEGEIVLSGNELLEQLTYPAGLLAIGNTQITLHIYDPFEDHETLEAIPANSPKFHICDCRTLESMKDQGRFNRYVTSNRTDGYFKVRPYNKLTRSRHDALEAVLLPCKNCLRQLDYQGYKYARREQRDNIVMNFSVEDFFEDFKSIFRCLPLYTQEAFPEGSYSSSWAKTSRDARHKARWTCSCCKVNCEEAKGLLHTHHKDGNRGNDRPSNHEILCATCHKNRPFHGRMHIKPDEKLRLEHLRIDQGLTRHCASCQE